ncbi:hypothetical protein D3C73_1213380 [compost metagenome]
MPGFVFRALDGKTVGVDFVGVGLLILGGQCAGAVHHFIEDFAFHGLPRCFRPLSIQGTPIPKNVPVGPGG